MSGYGRQGNRRSGRGHGRPNGTSRKTSSSKKKNLNEYIFYIGSSRQASDYEITSEYLFNHIQMTFDYGNDIAESLRTLEKPDKEKWEPTLQVSEEQDEDIKKRENNQFQMIFKAKLDRAIKRQETYDNNLFKAYALLWKHCAKAMQNKIATRSDFTNKILNDPLNLLKAIKEHSLNYQESRYEMAIIVDAIKTVFNLKQKENENLQDYTRRFKTATEVLKSHIGGPVNLTKYVSNMKEYDKNDVDKIKKLNEMAFEQLLAYLYLWKTPTSQHMIQL